MNYRSDLNGLRAVAVILVILFHLDLTWIKGGFLGVDVFLVLSGYFISRNIITELNSGLFTFRNFYRKRIRRILPAQLFTVLITVIAGYFILMPSDLKDLGNAGMYSVLSVVNIYYYLHTGYFDATTASRPMMQMWSLSLEEQFYFIWPFLLFLFFRFRKGLVWFLGIVTLASFILAVMVNEKSPTAAFFLLPFRVFEFSLGTVCVLLERRFQNRISSSAADLAGLACIVGSAIWLGSDVPMPGVFSLLPCAGTMLLILTGDSKVKQVLLGNKLSEFIGKVSYSAYLIHWPLIVYYKYYSAGELTPISQALLCVITFLLAFLMWKFIENIFRRHTPVKFDRVWIWAPVCMAGICLFSYRMVSNNGYPQRFPDLSKLLNPDEVWKERNKYYNNSDSALKQAGISDSSRKVLIIGNSHAYDLAHSLINNGLKAKITLLPTSSRCYNFGTPIQAKYKDQCEEIRATTLRWPGWSATGVVLLHDSWKKLDLPDLAAFLKEVRNLTSAPVYIFGPKMTLSNNLLPIIQKAKNFTPQAINQVARKYMDQDRISFTHQLKQFLNTDYYRSQHIYFIDLLQIQCGEDCKDFRIVSDDVKLLYFDDNHFTERGATEFGTRLKAKYPEFF